MNAAMKLWLEMLAIACVLPCSVQVAAAEDPKSGRQVEAATTLKLNVDGRPHEVEMRYWLYLPTEYSAEGEQQWPLLLFLHGSGERGDDLSLVKKHGPPKLIEEGKSFPMIVVSPQCPKEKRWDAAQLAKLVDELANTHRVDRSRLYVTGLSMGGAGTWSLLIERPGTFAAAVPICGRVDRESAAKLTTTPIWIVVGAKDRAELVASNKEAAAAIEQGGGKQVKLTVYPDAGHDSWTETYANPDIFEWLLKQRIDRAK